jgi:hypothetical protein
MGEEGTALRRGSLLLELERNLASWSFFEYLVIFVDVPLLLLLTFAFTQDIRDQYLIFHTTDLFSVPTYVLSAYTHSDIYHLAGNLVLYFITAFAIFLFENDRHRFRIMAAVSFLLVPVICSFLTIALWHVFGRVTSMQGFSGIAAALLAYAFMAGVTWALSGALEQFDLKASFVCPPWKYYISSVLLALIAVMVVFLGILEGRFAPSGNAVSNGIAHFGGFFTGLISYTVIDIVQEKRKNFDAIILISVAIGIIYYIVYLMEIVNIVRVI